MVVRAITSADECPSLLLDDVPGPMKLRAGPSMDFPIMVCEALMPAATRRARVVSDLGQQNLPVPNLNAKNVAVLGDAGCRVEIDGGKVKVQDCNRGSDKSWPFDVVAKNIKNSSPDLVIHVGDYVYRQSECPAEDSADCGNSPYGDNWPTWQADFFDDAATLFDKVPWVFTRGNHENCSRSGDGWFRLFDTAPYVAPLDPSPTNANPTQPCEDISDPYLIDYAGLHLAIFDDASAPDKVSKKAQDALDWSTAYQQRFAALQSTLTCKGWDDAWLVTHQPIWGIKPKDPAPGKTALFDLLTPAMSSAFNAVFAKNAANSIDLVISGHIHLVQMLDMGSALPAQVVIGNGGTSLEKVFSTDFALSLVQAVEPDIQNVWSLTKQFGHVMITPGTSAGSHRLQVFDLNNSAIAGQTFTLMGNQLTNTP
jgi:hypothetical protein